MKTLLIPDALEAAGVVVKVLPDWDVAHSNGTYRWRESPEDPAGAMWHHTATSAYTPNRDKANGYLGMGDPTLANPRLYQEDGPGRVPIYTIANAYPAPISSGTGVRNVLEDFVKQNRYFVGKQTQPDDGSWAGNTHYWNTEVILDGIGTAMPQSMWDVMVDVALVLNYVMPDWTPARHIGHAMHTRRKIDLRDGRFPDMATTIDALRLAMEDEVEYRTVKNVPDESWARKVVDWGIDDGKIINIKDDFPDDWERLNMTDGRLWTFLMRMWDSAGH